MVDSCAGHLDEVKRRRLGINVRTHSLEAKANIAEDEAGRPRSETRSLCQQRAHSGGRAICNHHTTANAIANVT